MQHETRTSSAATALRTARMGRDLSQEAFARLIGVSVRTVARWESGNSKPSALALRMLAAEGGWAQEKG